MPRRAVLLINVGTPAGPQAGAVARFLRQFLCDPAVIDLPAWLRWPLVHGVIVPLRAHRAARAYRHIWTAQGAPLLVHCRALQQALGEALGEGWQVELAMRYGEPSMQAALLALRAADVQELVVVPLFAQYAVATTGTALAWLFHHLAQAAYAPAVRAVPPFFAHERYIAALCQSVRASLKSFAPEVLLMSYHGLPRRQIRRSHVGAVGCDATTQPCPPVDATTRSCYRAQCYATSRALAAALGLKPAEYRVGFQSRFGKGQWTGPQLEEIVQELAARGVKRLAVVAPSFAVDCLETLEELGHQLRERWKALSGGECLVLPCLNAEPAWVEALAQMCLSHAS